MARRPDPDWQATINPNQTLTVAVLYALAGARLDFKARRIKTTNSTKSRKGPNDRSTDLC